LWAAGVKGRVKRKERREEERKEESLEQTDFNQYVEYIVLHDITAIEQGHERVSDARQEVAQVRHSVVHEVFQITGYKVEGVHRICSERGNAYSIPKK
jgi:hypothetical protein